MSEKNALNLSRQAKEAYFCPYCKVVTSDPTKFKAVYKHNQWTYTCFSRGCGKQFFQDTYKMQSKNGQHYFTTNKENGDEKEIIEEIITNLYKKSLSYRMVADATHFSRKMIANIIQNKIRYKSCSYDTFYTEVLGLAQNIDSRSIIVKLLDFGLSKRQIMKKTSLDYKSLERLSGGYTSKSNEKSKVKIKNNTVTYSYFLD